MGTNVVLKEPTQLEACLKADFFCLRARSLASVSDLSASACLWFTNTALILA